MNREEYSAQVGIKYMRKFESCQAELAELRGKMQRIEEALNAAKTGELPPVSALIVIGLDIFPQPEEIPEDVKRWAEAALRAEGKDLQK